MDLMSRIQPALESQLLRAHSPSAPPRLLAAMRHAVFPGGARIRPQLCLAVARACGDSAPALSDAAAVAIELLHCASLVHDDMPAFDDADTRRGQPTVHRLYGEPLALLTGDGLIVMAYQALAHAGATVERDGSETEAYLVTRLLAYCLEYQEGIAFSEGISATDEPAVLGVALVTRG